MFFKSLITVYKSYLFIYLFIFVLQHPSQAFHLLTLLQYIYFQKFCSNHVDAKPSTSPFHVNKVPGSVCVIKRYTCLIIHAKKFYYFIEDEMLTLMRTRYLNHDQAIMPILCQDVWA